MKKSNKNNSVTSDIHKIAQHKLSDFNKNSFKTTEVIFLIIVTAIIGLIIGYLLNHSSISNNNTDQHIKEFVDNYQYIIDNYYEDVDKEQLIVGAIDGMLSSLDDDYSQLLEHDENSSFYMNLEGGYEGIGVEIYNDKDNNIVVLGVLENSPAERAGIQAGDIINSIDNKSLENTDINELTKYIQKNVNSTYTLVITRNGEQKTIDIAREAITIKSVASKIIDRNNHKIGYIYISVFSNTTPTQFKQTLTELEKAGIDSLIIDVRENSGGHLTTAVSILSNLLDSTNVIYQIEQNNQKTKYYSFGAKTVTHPIVVLQNSNSASASELLSAALKEAYGATIVGEASYGKGTVQEVVTLSNGDSYKFTTKKWLTPDGNWVDGTGVMPDVEVKLNEQYLNNPIDDNDNQLQAAIDVILNK